MNVAFCRYEGHEQIFDDEYLKLTVTDARELVDASLASDDAHKELLTDWMRRRVDILPTWEAITLLADVVAKTLQYPEGSALAGVAAVYTDESGAHLGRRCRGQVAERRAAPWLDRTCTSSDSEQPPRHPWRGGDCRSSREIPPHIHRPNGPDGSG